jgi:hypothetical protein
MKKQQRLEEYYNRLREQPLSTTIEDAMERLAQTLMEVEDELSGIPRSDLPPHKKSDGRMYPPLPDNISRNPDGSISARTKGHNIEIGKDGSITIRDKRTGQIEFQQPGGGK